MYGRGPMPKSMRIAILLFFAAVFAMPGAMFCAGLVQVGGTTAVVVAENLPTAEDQRMADALEARAAANGTTLEVSAVEIAQARRLGQLDQLEEATDAMFPVDVPRPTAPAAEVPAHRADGAFYRDEVAPEPEVAFPWGWAVVALGTLLASLAAMAGAFVMLGSRDGADPDGAGGSLG